MPRGFTRSGLLSVTIAAMAALLLVKSVALVRAAAPVPHATPTVPATPIPLHPAVPSAACVPIAPTPGPEPLAPPSTTEQKLLLDLRKRSAELDARKAALDERERLLDAAEKRLAAKVVELKALDQKLIAASAGRERARNGNWEALVKLYESMRPRDAATIFNGLAMPVLLEVVHRMSERKAAAILAAMQPEKARALTTELAGLPATAKGTGS